MEVLSSPAMASPLPSSTSRISPPAASSLPSSTSRISPLAGFVLTMPTTCLTKNLHESVERTISKKYRACPGSEIASRARLLQIPNVWVLLGTWG